MKKKMIYLSVLAGVVGFTLVGCGSGGDGASGSDKTETAAKKANFDDLVVGLSKDDLVKNYGEPKSTITDVTEVTEVFTEDMTSFQTAATDDKKVDDMVAFFGGTEEKMQEAMTEIASAGGQDLEIANYEVDGKEVHIYLLSGKVFFRNF